MTLALEVLAREQLQTIDVAPVHVVLLVDLVEAVKHPGEPCGARLDHCEPQVREALERTSGAEIGHDVRSVSLREEDVVDGGTAGAAFGLWRVTGSDMEVRD